MNASTDSSPLKPGADGTHLTYCRLCEALCGLAVEVEDGRIKAIHPDREHPVSKGHVCVKGTRMDGVVHDPDRILTPMRRTGGPGEFEPVSWDEALDDICARLQRLHSEHGGSAIGLYMGNPASFSMNHYMRGVGLLGAMGSAQLYGPAHVDTMARNFASQMIYGTPKFPMPDIENCDFFLMFGANPMVSKMSLLSAPRAMQKLDAIAERGRVVVVDPRKTETATRYDHVAVRPDTDVWLIAGMLKVIFDEGLFDADAIDMRVTGWAELRKAVCAMDLDAAEQRSGVPVEEITSLARGFAGARTAAAYGRLGTNRGRFPTLTTTLIDALNLITGRFGAVGGWGFGFYPLDPVEDDRPADPLELFRSRIGDFPVSGIFQVTGTLAAEITTPGEGQLKALLVDSGNPARAYPQGEDIQSAFEQLDLMVVMDFYVTETAQHADYILPTATFLERSDFPDLWLGTMLEPMLQFTEPVLPPLGEARTEYDIYDEIMKRMGLPDPFSVVLGMTDPDTRQSKYDFFDLMLRSGSHGDKFGANPDGLNLAKLRDTPRGIFMPDALDMTKSWDFICHPDGKAVLWHEIIESEFARLAREPAPDADGLKLFGRRKLKSLNSWLHNNKRLLGSDRATLLMHPADAGARALEDGQTVEIRSRQGAVQVELEISDSVIPGSVCYPHGWGHTGGWQHANQTPGININELTSSDPSDFEPVTGVCHLDGVPVEVGHVPDPVLAE